MRKPLSEESAPITGVRNKAAITTTAIQIDDNIDFPDILYMVFISALKSSPFTQYYQSQWSEFHLARSITPFQTARPTTLKSVSLLAPRHQATVYRCRANASLQRGAIELQIFCWNSHHLECASAEIVITRAKNAQFYYIPSMDVNINYLNFTSLSVDALESKP